MPSSKDQAKVIQVELTLTNFSGFFDNRYSGHREYWLHGVCRTTLPRQHDAVVDTWLIHPVVEPNPPENMLFTIGTINDIVARDKK